MSRSNIAQRHATSYDALTVIRPISAAAISVTTSEAGIAVPVNYLDDFDLVIDTQSITGFVAGTATWTFTAEVSATLGGTYTAIASMTLPAAAADKYLLCSDGVQIAKILPTAAFIRVTATKVGAAGPLTYAAYLSSDC